MKKLFSVLVTEVDRPTSLYGSRIPIGLFGKRIYYINATDRAEAEAIAREHIYEYGYTDEDIDDRFDIDNREYTPRTLNQHSIDQRKA